MMTEPKSGKKTFGTWRIVFILVASAYLMMSLIQSQEAYAERKKVSGTGKAITTISQTKVFPGDLPKHEITLTSRLDTQESPNPDFGS